MTRTTVGDYELDDDPGRVDTDAAVAFLTTEAYWARWRGASDIKSQIAAAWRVVGAYDQAGAMVGFARAYGDGGCAYLADVYVLAGHRGAGLGQAIVRTMIEDGPGAGWRWMLHTSDAHGLYRQFGFAAPSYRYLERAPKSESAASRQPATAGTLVGQGGPARAAAAPARARAGRRGGRRRGTVPLVARAAGRGPGPPVRRDGDRGPGQRNGRPFAVVRAADDTVIGSTRFFDFGYWAWPDGHRPPGPDSCEIGYTWLSPSAIRTGANTEMKRLMLTHAFEVWQVSSVCLHTDARNQRSRDAMQRIGARYEGVLRAHRLDADGKPRDSARFSIVAAEWPAVRQHLDELDRRYG